MRSNYNTKTATSKPAKMPVWMLATSCDVEPELVEAKRDSDGRWLKQNFSMETPERVQSQANVMMAEKYGEDADCLFAGKRR